MMMNRIEKLTHFFTRHDYVHYYIAFNHDKKKETKKINEEKLR